tara:strand:- start:5 stop:451 length:447 start_codon:yes stop_codon:yes gene_type:complete
MLSNAAKYAIRAMLYLAINSTENKKIGAKEIAETLEVPLPFLAQLLRNLTAHELISSAKGPRGGYYLNEENQKKTIWEVMVSIDGTAKFDECFLGLAKCNDENPCPAHVIVAPFKERMLKDFMQRNIGKLTKEIKNNGTVISLKNLEF